MEWSTYFVGKLLLAWVTGWALGMFHKLITKITEQAI